MLDGGFAIIDFETTGLFPGRHDRIIEVAVVHTDRLGNVTGVYETLVNPGRDLGRQDIHGITAAEIQRAPAFEQIAPRLVELLSGRVIVAHNARFDTGFLLAELDRIAYGLDIDLPSICTMRLAREFLPGAGRSLADCCAALDINLNGAHRASVDALATAQLLAAYIGMSEDLAYWDGLIDGAAELVWPPLAIIDSEWIARELAQSGSTSFLQRISTQLPDYSGPSEHSDYLALLDRCLLDRRLAVHEAEALVEVAESLGIGRETCQHLHRSYFDDLVRVAWADAHLTSDEVADIVTVGKLLEVGSEAILAAMLEPTPVDSGSSEARSSSFALEAGDLVVLTGEMSRPRELWLSELEARGFVPWSAVTKKVKLVVAADPDSLSGKARKARDYGITIVDEAGLESLLRRAVPA
ncbi:exonuclease domain-containing protein [Herbiconiux sp. L3-i23]|uniref:exonuclease domain-containing protein n=1 Tax=Herbiconiux sp. L3-i23 TaxID=2905871 RepID=UPI002073705E|nr:exonuclease domain-containing protein [Herbiconiux sp. L3-i23]